MIVKLHSEFEDCITFHSKKTKQKTNKQTKKPEKRHFLSSMNLIEKWLT